MKRDRHTDKGNIEKIVKESNEYYDWYKDDCPTWKVVEEFEVEEK